METSKSSLSKGDHCFFVGIYFINNSRRDRSGIQKQKKYPTCRPGVCVSMEWMVYFALVYLRTSEALLPPEIRPKIKAVWKPLVFLNKALSNPYFWEEYGRGGRLTSHNYVFPLHMFSLWIGVLTSHFTTWLPFRILFGSPPHLEQRDAASLCWGELPPPWSWLGKKPLSKKKSKTKSFGEWRFPEKPHRNCLVSLL